MMARIDEKALDSLRARVATLMSPYRMAHTKGVEEMAARLAALYAPEQENILRAAALLHDITKEYDNEKQQELMRAAGIVLRPDEACSPKTWHAITAPLVIARDFADFAVEEILSAVRWHTTGREGMTLAEAILYLADYIEEGRRFADCVTLRERFFSANPAAMSAAARAAHLCDVLLLSFDMTIQDLAATGNSVCLDTLAAKADLEKRKEIV